MFIEQLQMTNISFSTCVIILQFQVFYFRATENFPGGEGGGTTEGSVDSFLDSTVHLRRLGWFAACPHTGYRTGFLELWPRVETE